MRPVLIKTDCHEQRHHEDATTDSKTSAHTDDLFGTEFAWIPHWPDKSVEVCSHLATLLHLKGGFADGLDYERNRALVPVEIGDGQRNAFTKLVQNDDDKLAGLRGRCNLRWLGRRARCLDRPNRGICVFASRRRILRFRR